MAKIRFNTQINKSTEVIIPAGLYPFVLSSIKEDEARNKKQLIKVVMTCTEDGEYKGCTMKQAFSIEDEIGNKRFAELLQAINGPDFLDEPLSEMDTDDILNKPFKADIIIGSRDWDPGDGSEVVNLVYNDVVKNGFHPIGFDSDVPEKAASKRTASSSKSTSKSTASKSTAGKGRGKAKDDDPGDKAPAAEESKADAGSAATDDWD